MVNLIKAKLLLISNLPDLYNVVEKVTAPFPNLSKIWIGPFCLIDVRSPEYIKTIMSSKRLTDRAAFYSFPFSFMSGADSWRRHRKMVKPSVDTTELAILLLSEINDRASKVTEILDAFVGKEAVSIVHLLSAMTLESSLRSAFGVEDATDTRRATFSEMSRNLVGMCQPQLSEILEAPENENESDENPEEQNIELLEKFLNRKQNLTNKEIEERVSSAMLEVS